MSGILIGGTSGLTAALMREITTSKDSRDVSLSTSMRVDQSTHPREQALFSIMDKQEVTRQKFEMGVLKFRTIKMQRDSSDTSKAITEWYKENFPNITESEIDTLVNKAVFEEMELL